MIKVNNYFDDLILFDGARFYPPVMNGNVMRIQTENVSLSPNHPYNINNDEVVLQEAILIFDGITKSIRKIQEYIEGGKINTFTQPYEIIDISTIVSSSTSKIFEFDGILVSPFAHVDWYIEADSFTLEVLRRGNLK